MDKDKIDGDMTNAKRLLALHVLILQMLISRFQACEVSTGSPTPHTTIRSHFARANRYMRLVASLPLG